MQYQRLIDIEERLQAVLKLIQTGQYSTPELADALGVSIPTISRDVTALRERGFLIQSKRSGNAWHYVLPPPANNSKKGASVESGSNLLRRKPR